MTKPIVGLYEVFNQEQYDKCFGPRDDDREDSFYIVCYEMNKEDETPWIICEMSGGFAENDQAEVNAKRIVDLLNFDIRFRAAYPKYFPEG